MATSYPATPLTDLNTWVNAVAVTPALSGKKMFIQNRNTNDLLVFFGGASAPAANEGTLLKPGQSIEGTSTAIWLKGKGMIGLLELDS